MSDPDSWDLLVKRSDLTVTELRPADFAVLQSGEVRLAVETFGLTAVTMTYAVLPDSPIPFFNAFLAPAGYGRVPVWGFARVVETRNADIEIGSRYFGYLPMSTHVVVRPEISADGFVDLSAERAFLHPWYRGYRRTGPADFLDDRRALLWPLFSTSYNLASFLSEQASLGARSVLITSASSKTAIGTATLLAEQGLLPAVGLTSSGNVGFVEKLGVYDRVASYSDLAAVSMTGPTVLVDFSGEPTRLSALCQRFAGQLCHTALVGYAHPSAMVRHAELHGPKPVIFFTPAVEQQRIAEEGADSYFTGLRAAEDRFIRASESWLTVQHQRGPAAMAEIFRSLLAGTQPPDTASAVSP